jgi:hypothetical protein
MLNRVNEVAAAEAPIDYIRAATIRRINHFLSDPSLSVYPDLKGMCERVSDSYRNRVIIELLQNAHDAHSAVANDGRIKFILDVAEGPHGTLYVANDGAGFARENFDALCSPTRTTKDVNEAIGNKGVGFLSVFQVCAHPEIFSRLSWESPDFDGFCFQFADDLTLTQFLEEEKLGADAALVIASMPRVYLGCPTSVSNLAVEELAKDGYATVVRMPLKSADAAESVAAQLRSLTEESPPVQLFLTRIATLSVERRGQDTLFRTLTRKSNVVHEEVGLRLMTVTCGLRKYVVVEKTVPYDQVKAVIQRDVMSEKMPQAWLGWTGDSVLSIAVAANGAPLDGRLYNFLPMGPEAGGVLPGYLDAPFLASLNRLTLQSGVELNQMFLSVGRDAAVAGARAAKANLPDAQARQVVLDLLMWAGPGGDDLRNRIMTSHDALLPSIPVPRSPKGWATFADARSWPADDFITASLAARTAPFPLLDPSIDAKRLGLLEQFLSGIRPLRCTTEERAVVVEGVASDLAKRKTSIERWNRFYASLRSLFKDTAEALHGRRLLLTARRELELTDTPMVARGKRRRLSAVFLPPLRDAQSAEALKSLPRNVQRRIAYLHPDLEISRDGTNVSRRFLVGNGLLREYESREILRLLSNAIAQPGETRDPDGLRWQALTAMMRIVVGEDTADAIVADLNVHVPTREGWSRANLAYMGDLWARKSGSGLERLFDRATGISTELDLHAQRLLRRYSEWPVEPGHRDGWVTFLHKAGVSDTLRPVPALPGTSPRSWPHALASTLTARAGLPKDQTDCWKSLMVSGDGLANPQTIYTTSGAMRAPGQIDFDALAPVVGEDYAREIIRMIERSPDVLRMTVFKPDHPHAPDRRQWPSPIASFVEGVAWVPLSQGDLERLQHAWLPGSEARTPPPLLPLVSPDLRDVLSRCEIAAEELRKAGLSEYGSRRSAWRFLSVAGDLIDRATHQVDVERIYSAAQDAWQVADLQQLPPAQLRLLGRVNGEVTVAPPELAQAPGIVVSDGDDRQLFASTAQSGLGTLVIEPPSNRATEVATYLAAQFPNIVRRASAVEASYESGGQPIRFEATDALIEEELGDQIRQIVVLTQRYRNSLYRGPIDQVLQRLSQLRIRFVEELSIRVGTMVDPVPMFSTRAVLHKGDEGQTILCPVSLKGTGRLLVAIGESLGEALGSRRFIGEPILAFAAQLGPDALSSSHEDYAAILNAPVEVIGRVLGAARASIGNMLRTLRPFIALFAGREAAAAFVTGGGLQSEDDVRVSVRALAHVLPMEPDSLVTRCREAGEVEPVAIALGVDLAQLNAAIERLGAPYAVVDLTDRHQATLAAFLTRKDRFIRESLRATFKPKFDLETDLSEYVHARDASLPPLPENFGRRAISLNQDIMQVWLDRWMADNGIVPATPIPEGRQAIDAVRDYNQRQLRSWTARFREAILIRLDRGIPLRQRWLSLADVEGALLKTAASEGWMDFDRLTEGSTLGWMARNGMWPRDWPTSLDALGLSETERATFARDELAARNDTVIRRRTIEHSGGIFTVGVDTLGTLANQIAGRVSKNAALLATSTRAMSGTPTSIGTRGSGGGGRSGGSIPRLSDDEREVIGFFGEAITFNWLKQRFGSKRVVDESAWKSGYRQHICGEKGDDGLGYDFEVTNGGTHWYFEVKATKLSEPQAKQTIELGSSEIAHAESCKSDKRFRYRILYVMNALQPERASIFPLPNPRSRAGLAFFAEPESTGVRLIFPLER